MVCHKCDTVVSGGAGTNPDNSDKRANDSMYSGQSRKSGRGPKDERGQAIADNIQDRAQTLCEHGSRSSAKPTPRHGSIKEKITQ